MARRLGLWALVAGVVVLSTRAVVYALAPQSVLLAALAKGQGGPRLAGALTGGVLLASGLAAVVLSIAAMAVRERLALERRRLVETPRLRLPLLAGRAIALFLVTSFAFAVTESYIHWRAGLGWHGLHCLVGPVHRDAIPVLGALSLVAVAMHGAVEHLLAWARRLVAALASRLPGLQGATALTCALDDPHPSSSGLPASARGPPARFVSVPSS